MTSDSHAAKLLPANASRFGLAESEPQSARRGHSQNRWQTFVMKYSLTILFIFCTIVLSGQNVNKDDLLICFRTGDEIRYNLERQVNNDVFLPFKESNSINRLREHLESNKFQSGEYNLQSSMHFVPTTKKFIVSVICAKWIKTNTDWGLNDYLFIFELHIDYNKALKSAKIVNHRLYDKNSNLKEWWQQHMNTYKQDKYGRSVWGKERKFVPPPPPPPETEDWFYK